MDHVEGDLSRVLERTARALAPLELHLRKSDICLFTVSQE